MARPPKKNRRKSAINLWQRLVCVAVIAVPPVVLAGRMVYGLLDYADAILAKAAPLASAFASASLGRGSRTRGFFCHRSSVRSSGQAIANSGSFCDM